MKSVNAFKENIKDLGFSLAADNTIGLGRKRSVSNMTSKQNDSANYLDSSVSSKYSNRSSQSISQQSDNDFSPIN